MSKKRAPAMRPTVSDHVCNRTVSRAPSVGDRTARKKTKSRVCGVGAKEEGQAPAVVNWPSLFDLPEYDDWGLLVDRSLFD